MELELAGDEADERKLLGEAVFEARMNAWREEERERRCERRSLW